MMPQGCFSPDEYFWAKEAHGVSGGTNEKSIQFIKRKFNLGDKIRLIETRLITNSYFGPVKKFSGAVEEDPRVATGTKGRKGKPADNDELILIETLCTKISRK